MTPPFGLSLDSRSATIRTAACLAAVAVLWATVELLGYSIMSRYAPEQIVGMRYAVHLAVLAAVCIPRTGWRRLLATRRPWLQLARGVCMFVMPAAFIFGADGLTSSGIWSMFWVAPVMVLPLAAWLLGERVPPAVWFFAIAGCAGSFLLFGTAPLIELRAWAPLLGALSFAVYVVLSRHLRDERIETSLLYTGLAAFVCMLPVALADWQPVHAEDLWRIVAIGTLGLLLLYLLDLALEDAAASFVAPLLYGVVVCESALRALLSGDLPSAGASGGAVLVVIVMLSSLLLGATREQH